MSQSRESNEPSLSTLSDKRQKNERQKMIQELKNMKMYEEGMNDTDMSDLLKVVQESQTMANLTSHNITDDNLPETAHPPTPLSYSRVVINKSPPTLEKRDTSSDQTQLVRRNKSLLQEKQVESPNEPSLTADINKSLMTKETKDAQALNITKARFSNVSDSLEGMNENKQMNHQQNSQMRQEDKIPKWKINPLDASTNPNEERLVAAVHYNSIDNEDCAENSGGDGANTSDNVDKAVTRLSNHLHLIAESWHNYRSCSVESKFEWGSAIKVNETNGSWNRKIIADDESKPVGDTNQSNETNLDVAESRHRRRTCTRTNSAIYDYISDSDNKSENSDKYFQIGTKRQKAPPKKLVASRSVLRDKRDESTLKSELNESAPMKKPQHATTAMATVVCDENAETEEEEEEEVEEEEEEEEEKKKKKKKKKKTSDEPPNKLKRSLFEESASSVYPRRIVPPKPEDRIRSGRQTLHYDDRIARLQMTKKSVEKKQEDEKDQVGRVVERKKDRLGLQDTDIAITLEKHYDDNNKDVFTSNEHSEITPLHVSSRFKLGVERLTEAQKKEKEADAIRREHERIKKDVFNRQKAERLKKRIRDEAEKIKQEEALRIRKAQREDDWNGVSTSRSKRQSALRTELFPDGFGPENSDGPIVTQTNRFATCDNEDELITGGTYDVGHEPPEYVECPICNKKFPSEEIMAHAAVCEEFQGLEEFETGAGSSDATKLNSLSVEVVGKPSGRKNASKFECQICATFTTMNGKQFEEHVHYCTKHHRDSLTGSAVNTIIEVSTSPLRAVRPISQQTDSEINYKGQFLPKTRSKTDAGKKRKR